VVGVGVWVAEKWKLTHHMTIPGFQNYNQFTFSGNLSGCMRLTSAEDFPNPSHCDFVSCRFFPALVDKCWWSNFIGQENFATLNRKTPSRNSVLKWHEKENPFRKAWKWNVEWILLSSPWNVSVTIRTYSVLAGFDGMRWCSAAGWLGRGGVGGQKPV